MKNTPILTIQGECQICGGENNRHEPDCDTLNPCGCGMADCRECSRIPGATLRWASL